MTVGDRIKEKRIELGMTQEDLGKACGVLKQAIYKYETGLVTNIPLENIEKLAHALNMSPAELMGWTSTADVKTFDALTPEERAHIMRYRNLEPEIREIVDQIVNR